MILGISYKTCTRFNYSSSLHYRGLIKYEIWRCGGYP